MKNKSTIISVFLLAVSIFLSVALKPNLNKTNAQLPASNNENKQCYSSNLGFNDKEMRAIWIPFMSLNMKNTDYSENEFKEKFDNIICESLKHKFNALIVQVRPFSDALYPSKYYPWSHLISAKQGIDPGFDPLDYMVTATHKAGLQFHAWINPLRIQVNNLPDYLCDSSVYFSLKNNYKIDDIILETSNGKYLNPAYPEVRKLIVDGIKEIVEKYPVDGIHFDDYFYPSNELTCDETSYENYCNLPENTQPLSLQDWRFANINSLISATYNAIKSMNSNVTFGISPAGNLENNAKISADVHTWCNTAGYIDYICPQIYFSPEHPILPSTKAAKQWKEIIKLDKIKLYYGLAMYKAGSNTADCGTWKNHDDILKSQVEQFRKIGCDGFMFFSFEDLKKQKAPQEIKNLLSVLN